MAVSRNPGRPAPVKPAHRRPVVPGARTSRTGGHHLELGPAAGAVREASPSSVVRLQPAWARRRSQDARQQRSRPVRGRRAVESRWRNMCGSRPAAMEQNDGGRIHDRPLRGKNRRVPADRGVIVVKRVDAEPHLHLDLSVDCHSSPSSVADSSSLRAFGSELQPAAADAGSPTDGDISVLANPAVGVGRSKRSGREFVARLYFRSMWACPRRRCSGAEERSHRHSEEPGVRPGDGAPAQPSTATDRAASLGHGGESSAPVLVYQSRVPTTAARLPPPQTTWLGAAR